MEDRNTQKCDSCRSGLEETNDLISILAHNLRTPISTIIGFSELILECLDNSDYKNLKRYSEIVSKQAKVANSQILSLSEWSFDSQKNPDYSKKLDVSKLIDQLIDDYLELANKKNIEIIKHLQLSTNEILGNKEVIEIILRNLISNAIKFTAEGGKIEIVGLEKNDTIEIIVKDNGIGIDQSDIGKIFEKKTSKPGTAGEKGLGIGLHLCKRIISASNEKLWVVSKKGEGTEFHFTALQKKSTFIQNGNHKKEI